jgi:hypothetical protein
LCDGDARAGSSLSLFDAILARFSGPEADVEIDFFMSVESGELGGDGLAVLE